jgi:type III secretory pathway component EscU
MYEELGKLVRARPLQEASMKNVTCHQLWKVKKKVRKNIKKLVQSSYNDSTFSVVYAVFPLIGGIMTTFFIRIIIYEQFLFYYTVLANLRYLGVILSTLSGLSRLSVLAERCIIGSHSTLII